MIFSDKPNVSKDLRLPIAAGIVLILFSDRDKNSSFVN